MAYWLLKTEPTVYAYADLERDGHTVWDGVNNNLALKYLRTAVSGDLALIYHTGDERQAVGLAEVTSAPYPDPKLSDPKRTVVDVRAVRSLPRAVSLAQMKADPRFEGFELLRIARLSIVPVPAPYWAAIADLATDPLTLAAP